MKKAIKKNMPNSDKDLSPIEAAVLAMDADIQISNALLREIKNQMTMYESAFKLMRFELSEIKKSLPKRY